MRSDRNFLCADDCADCSLDDWDMPAPPRTWLLLMT